MFTRSELIRCRPAACAEMLLHCIVLDSVEIIGLRGCVGVEPLQRGRVGEQRAGIQSAPVAGLLSAQTFMKRRLTSARGESHRKPGGGEVTRNQMVTSEQFFPTYCISRATSTDPVHVTYLERTRAQG